MTPKFLMCMLCGLLAVILALGAVGCGVIVEEEEKEKDEWDREMIEIIDQNLTQLATVVNNPTDERMCVDALPMAFQRILTYGDNAIPYLLEVVDTCTEYYGVDEDAYMRCVIACYAAYKIRPDLYLHRFSSPDQKFTLVMQPATFLKIGDPNIGTIYYVRLKKADTNEELIATGRISSSAVLTWSDNHRFAIFCDRQHDWNTRSTVTVFDTVKNRFFLVNTPYMLEYYSNLLGKTCSVLDLRYQHIKNGDLMFWFGMKADDGTVITGEIAASVSLNVLHEYTVQNNDFSAFVDTVPAHTGDGEAEKHYWYNGETVWTVTKDAEGYFNMTTDGTIGYMIRQEKEGEA